VHAKSTDELISFGFNDRSEIHRVQMKTTSLFS